MLKELGLMRIFKVLLFSVTVVLITSCKSVDFTVLDASYQQWYDGRGTTSGVNFYISLQAKKKIKNMKFTSVEVDNHELNPIVVKGKKKITGILLLKRNDTIKVAAPLLLKGEKPQITDTTSVILEYKRNKKVFKIPITHLIRKQKLFYP